MIDASSTPEICNFDDHAFPDENVLRFEITMEDSLDVHHDEGLNDLLKDTKNFLHRQLFIFLLIVVQKISLLAIFHYDFELFAFLIEMGVIDFDEIGVYKFFHYFYFFECLISFEGIDMYSFEGKGFIFAILDEIYTAEASFSDGFDGFVVLHFEREVF